MSKESLHVQIPEQLKERVIEIVESHHRWRSITHLTEVALRRLVREVEEEEPTKGDRNLRVG